MLMLIKEMFNFEDGRTVFLGEVSEGNKYIKSCECNIYIEDKFFKKIKIEGEMIPKDRKVNLRSISSTDKINISDIPYRNNKVWIKSIE